MSGDFDLEDLLAKLPLQSKIKLLAGDGFWHTQTITSPKLFPLRMSDGPNGLRGTRFFNSVPSNCFPASTGLGSSFDVDLARKVGQTLAEEARAKGVHLILAPTVNTQRSPLGGRGFESFSEDPHLNGTIAAAYINGIQENGIAATIKHFVANDQEYQRFSIDSIVSERALREIYLKPFQIAIKKSNPWALMTAFNRVNGIHCSEHPKVLNDILREEWGYSGLVMSDWTGVYSTSESIKAGLDLEMPGPAVMRNRAVERAILSEKLFPEDIDKCVRRILGLIKHAYASGVPFNAPEHVLDTPEVRATLRTAAADATVLLKNDKNLLPIRKPKSIAVIGPNAKYAMTSGGGSAVLLSTYVVTPLEAIGKAAKDIGAEVNYTIGAQTYKYLPLLNDYIKQDNGQSGALLEFWNESPSESFLDPEQNIQEILPEPVWTTVTNSTDCFLVDGVDDTKVDNECWIRFSTTFTPDENGDWEFGMSLTGAGNLFIDGNLIIDLSTKPPPGDSFFGFGTADVRGTLKDLKTGCSYAIEVRLNNASFVEGGGLIFGRGGLRVGATPKIDGEEGLKKAAKVAKESDAILVIGLNKDWESEGFDRKDMKLPGLINRLVSEVIKANPNTIVVNQSGMPVEMPWIDEVSTVLQAFYGGNEVGSGIADVIFGAVNPSGKLALTFPKRLEDSPSYLSFGNKSEEYGKVYYNEGIYVGYRGFEKSNIAPLFAFGHGLSYTTFAYSDLQLTDVSPEGNFSVSFTVQNTGQVDGREVVQIYITDEESSLPRPPKELKGFTKVSVKAGQSVNATIDLERDALAFYDTLASAWVVEKGKFEVLVASSSADVKLRGDIVVEKGFKFTGL